MELDADAALNDSNTNRRMELDAAQNHELFERAERAHFVNLFHDVLEDMKRTLNVSDEYIETGLSVIQNAFNYRDGGNYSQINFSDIGHLCAHVYRLSPLSASVSRFMTSLALNNCTELRELVTGERSELTVMSLAGADGADMVGFCSAISGYPVRCPLNLTMVDKHPGWGRFMEKTFERAKSGTYGLVSAVYNGLLINEDFRVADLSFNDPPDIHEYIRKADIVIMKGLLSIAPSKDLFDIHQIVADRMAVGSILLLIDSPSFRHDISGVGLIKIYQYDPSDTLYYTTCYPQVHNVPHVHYYRGISCKSNFGITVYIKQAIRPDQFISVDLTNLKLLRPDGPQN